MNKNRTYRIYKITNKLTGKEYIGVTIQQVRTRFYQHCYSGECTYLNRAIKKYGTRAFEYNEICNALTQKDMEELEQYFIKYYNTLSPNGYNLTTGGKYSTFCDEIKNEMQKRMKQRWRDKRTTMNGALEALKNYVVNKRKKVIGINIHDGKTVLRFSTVNEAENSGYSVANVLCGKDIHSNYYHWFYDDGKPTEHYIGLAKYNLGGFGNYSRGRRTWAKCNKAKRIKAMRDSSAWRFKPVVSVNINTRDVKFYENTNDIARAGFSKSSVNECLQGRAKKGQGYCWFYKTTDALNYYLEQTAKLVGLPDPVYIAPVESIDMHTGIVIEYQCVNSVPEVFDRKKIRKVLRGKSIHHKGYYWKFK